MEPLSTFGLEDENEVRPFEWHDAARGLQSVAALLAGSVPAQVRADLLLIEADLMEAKSKNVPFRLLLRASGGVTPTEMDVRRGYF